MPDQSLKNPYDGLDLPRDINIDLIPPELPKGTVVLREPEYTPMQMDPVTMLLLLPFLPLVFILNALQNLLSSPPPLSLSPFSSLSYPIAQPRRSYRKLSVTEIEKTESGYRILEYEL